jgi:hypothetical protein
MQYRSEWAKANFLWKHCFGLTPYIAPTVWGKSSTIWDKGKGGETFQPA